MNSKEKNTSSLNYSSNILSQSTKEEDSNFTNFTTKKRKRINSSQVIKILILTSNLLEK